MKNFIKGKGMILLAMVLMFTMVMTSTVFATVTPVPVQQLKDVVTSDMMSGVLDQIVGLLPVVIPVMIGFIALRKGIVFLRDVLHSA